MSTSPARESYTRSQTVPLLTEDVDYDPRGKHKTTARPTVFCTTRPLLSLQRRPILPCAGPFSRAPRSSRPLPPFVLSPHAAYTSFFTLLTAASWGRRHYTPPDVFVYLRVAINASNTALLFNFRANRQLGKPALPSPSTPSSLPTLPPKNTPTRAQSKHKDKYSSLPEDTALCRQSAYSDRTVHISAHRIYTGPISTSVASSLERRIRLTATTQTTCHSPYALYDISVPHPARCAPSRSLHPHPGVTDSVLAHALDTVLCIGYNSHLHLHAQCTLPPHPFSAPPFSLSPPSPSPPHSPGGSTASAAQQYTTHDPSSDACVFAAWQPSGCALHIVQLTPYNSHRHPHAQYALQPRPHYSAIPASPTEKQWKDEERNADVQR
ncbi:hypothetical protein B0H14DRAFT_3466013 [Mycena olivaceomarginata]|nr:hypothetical protein B0H14DRAFT_3466013 [Mycena olivaceomarginata]